MDAPVLPLQHPAVHGIADTLGLDDVQRFERIAQLERRVILDNLLGEVVVRGHGRCERRSLLTRFIVLRRAGRECLTRSRVGRWIVDGEDFTCVAVDDRDKVTWMGVEIVVGT